MTRASRRACYKHDISVLTGVKCCRNAHPLLAKCPLQHIPNGLKSTEMTRTSRCSCYKHDISILIEVKYCQRHEAYQSSASLIAKGPLRHILNGSKATGITSTLPCSCDIYGVSILCKIEHCPNNRGYRSNSSASCERFDWSISEVCFQRREMTSGASFEYRIKAATMSL